MKIPLMFIGIALAIGTYFWWNDELITMLGNDVSSSSFRCLVNVGTGDCRKLWYVGLHETNQIASMVFYAGILMAGLGLFMARPRRGADENEFLDRPNIPPHL
jgi:hypothetical protein